MANKLSSSAVISFFSGEDSDHLAEIVFDGSEDDLGMEDVEDDNSEPDFDPLEVSIEGKYISFCNDINNYVDNVSV